MSWRYCRRLSLTNRVMALPYKGYALRISADGTLLSTVDNKLEEMLRASPELWVHNPSPTPTPAPNLDTSKETDSPSLDIETVREEVVKPKRRRRATTKRTK